MIFHVSIEAENPKRVASVIAEIWEGVAVPLDRLVNGSWMAFWGESPLSAIEVFPQGTNITKSTDDTHWFSDRTPGSRPTASHVALGTKLTEARVREIAARENWETKYVTRGDRFGVIEMWVNENLVIEWLTVDMQKRYEKSMKSNVAGAAKAS